MATVSRRFQDLWASRSTKASTPRRRRANRANFSTFGGAEQLEQRALLAGVTTGFVADYSGDNTDNFVGLAHTYGNPGKGAVVVTIDGAGTNGDDVFLRVVNGNYQFATAVDFNSGSLLGSYNSVTTQSSPSVVLTDTKVNAPPTPNTPAVRGPLPTAALFDTIYVRCTGMVDGTDSPTFTLIGASQTVDKALVVNFVDDNGNPLSDSVVTIGAPVKVATTSAGGLINADTTGNLRFVNNVQQRIDFNGPELTGGAVYIASESIAINAAVSSQNDVYLLSAIGDDNLTNGATPAGIAINQAVNATATGDIVATASGVAFNVNAGATLAGGTAATAAGSFTLDLQDADARIAGTINATNQSYFLRPTAGLPANATAHTITTRSASTKSQAGTVQGNQLVIYLANDSATGRDGTIDLQTAVSDLRITSSATTPASTLDYAITITNASDKLTIPSVAASKGDISISQKPAAGKVTGGQIDLQSAIDTLGAFSLSSDADLTVSSPITSAANITLASTGKTGSVTTSAAVQTANAATGLGKVTISAGKDVTINSLVQADNVGVFVTATSGQILSGTNLASDPTSRITGASATLKAATGINLGTNVSSLTAQVTGTGDLAIDDNGDLAQGSFVLSSLSANAGNVTVTSTRGVDATSVVAGGKGDVSITTVGDLTAGIGGDISVGSIIADNNAVILSAVGYDTDGVTVLTMGTISGNAPAANEINWTASDVVDGVGVHSTELYRNIPVVSATRLSNGDIVFSADGSVTLKSIVTTDGNVGITSLGGSITATNVNAVAVAALGNVSLTADGGSVTLGTVTAAASGTVSVIAAQGISDDGDATNTAITANTINLSAASSGVASDIGGVGTAVIKLAGVASSDVIALTVAQADTNVYAAAQDATNVYVTSVNGLTVNAAAVSLISIASTGAIADVEVQAASVSDDAGSIAIGSGRDLTVGIVQVAGGVFADTSSISLTAARSLLNANGNATDTILEADTLKLSASSLDGTFAASNLDSIVRLSAQATGAKGVVSLAFNRTAALTLDGVSTLAGNVNVTNASSGDFLIGSTILAGGVTAGGVATANSVTLATMGAIQKPSDVAEAEGTIFAAAAVDLSANSDITAITKAGQLAATSTIGVIDITQTGNVKVAAGGINATAVGASVTLAVTGSILSGPGSIVSETATVSATAGMDVRTSVDTLSATSTGGNVTVLESNSLDVGTAGIKALAGAVSVTLTQGTLNGGGRSITGNSVALMLLEAGKSIDVDTSASSLTASTAVGGSITLRNDKSFSVGAAGIVAGDTTTDDVTVTITKGGITAGAGSIKGDLVTLSATSGIVANTTANSINATSTAGDIALTQKGQVVTLGSIVASAGGVTVTNNDNVTVTSVQAIGAGKNVSISATGTNKKIIIGANSISADGDKVTLASTGGIDGTPTGTDPDITASTISLASTGGDVTATVKAATVTASALGNDIDHVLPADPRSDLDLTILGTKSVFLGTATGVNLTAAGDVTVHTGSNNIVVVAAPVAGLTTTYDTSGLVTYAVTSSAASGAGSLATVLANAGAATITGGGTAGVAFTTAIGSPIVLTSTIPVTSPLTLDGTQRINTTTGTLSTGRQVDIDGSRLVSGTAGFSFSGASDHSKVSGFAFYGFNKAGGAGIQLAPAADNVTIASNLFGVSSTGRVSSNANGIIVDAGVNAPVITGNTVVKSTEVGIKLSGVANAVVTDNLVGTNTTRTNLGNATGIQVNGTVNGNTLSGNVVAFNSVAGIHVNAADASGVTATATVVRGNEVLLNSYGILVNGATKNATVAGNIVTRNTLDGIKVNGSSQDVTIGGALDADRNYVGTTASNSLGLGNGRNGISVSSTGSGIVVQGNTVLGNGTANVADENAGVKFSGANSNGSSVTGNIINANRGAGILAARTLTGAIAVTKNTISSNSGSGVQVKTGTVVVGGTYSDSDATLRANANTINSNAAYGVNVVASAFAQIAGNSMASNRLGGILNGNISAPTITSVTRSAATGLLTVNFSGLVSGQVVHVYTGTPQGRTYLGKFLASSTTGTFTMSLAAQVSAGVSATVFAGAPITGTRTSVGVGTENTSAFAPVKSITRVA